MGCQRRHFKTRQIWRALLNNIVYDGTIIERIFLMCSTSFLQNEAFTDVTLACDGASHIKCHKIVLAACSPYFQSLFTSLSCKHPVVVLKDVKYLEIKAILEYMYRGEVNVAQDQLAALLKVAETLKVKGLVEENRGTETPNLPMREDELFPQRSPPSAFHSTPNPHSTLGNNSNSSSPPSNSTMSYSKNPYYFYSKPTNAERSSRMNLPMWAMPGLPLAHNSSPVPPQNQSQVAATAAAMLSSCYDAASPDLSPLHRKKLSSLLMNRDTPILRTVLGQGQTDSSQPVSLVCHPENQEDLNRMGSNQDRLDKNVRMEPLEDAQSPYTDFSVMEDEEKSKSAIPRVSPQSLSSDLKKSSSGMVPYVQHRPEWKRYKQYTRTEIMGAIEAVRTGMSALQAARKFGVPSRTLYDKVKKLGISTSRPFKRGTNGNNISYPYGLCNAATGYRNHCTDPDEQTMMNQNPTVESSKVLQNNIEVKVKTEKLSLSAIAAAAIAQATLTANPAHHDSPQSPSPNSCMMQYIHHNTMMLSPASGSEPHMSEMNGSSERERDDDEDQVEDLSVGRTQESRVIMPPMNQVSTIIKTEDVVMEENLNDVSREDTE